MMAGNHRPEVRLKGIAAAPGVDHPHQLVDAFRATLEEVLRADLLLEVVDAADPHLREHRATIEAVLEELGAIEQMHEDAGSLNVFEKLVAEAHAGVRTFDLSRDGRH